MSISYYTLRELEWLNSRPQMLHRYGFSPVCIRMCAWKSESIMVSCQKHFIFCWKTQQESLDKHQAMEIGSGDGFCQWCLDMGWLIWQTFMLVLSLNAFWQWEHLKGFPSTWVLSCRRQLVLKELECESSRSMDVGKNAKKWVNTVEETSYLSTCLCSKWPSTKWCSSHPAPVSEGFAAVIARVRFYATVNTGMAFKFCVTRECLVAFGTLEQLIVYQHRSTGGSSWGYKWGYKLNIWGLI